MDINVTKIKHKEPGSYKELTKFYADGVLVAEMEKSRDYFGGKNIKKTYKTKWNRSGLKDVLRTDMFSEDDFKDDCPILGNNHPGKALSTNKVKSLMDGFIDRYMESI